MAECELMTADKIAAESRMLQLAQRAASRHDFCVVTRLHLALTPLWIGVTAVSRCFSTGSVATARCGRIIRAATT